MRIFFILILSIQYTLAKDYDFKSLYKVAQERNPIIQDKELELKEIDSEIKSIKSDYYPKLHAIIGSEKRIAPDEASVESNKAVGELRVDYNLYQFGATKKKLDALKEEQKQKKRLINFTQEELKRSLMALYFEVLSHKKHKELILEELKYNQKLKKQVQSKREQGLVGRADVLEIEMREATLKNTLLKVTEEYQHGLDKLRKLTFVSHNQEINILGSLPHVHFSTSLSDLLESALKRNNELLNINSKTLALEYETDSSFSKRLPSLKLMGRYGRMRIDETYTSNDSQEGLVGLYLEIPLFDGGKRFSKQAINQARLERSKLKLKSTKHNLEIDLTHRFEKFQNIHKLLDLSETNLKKAKIYFNNVLSEYKRGVKNSLDLVSARDRLYQFQLNVINYNKDYQDSKLELERLSGINL
ncbi:MAG: hypothetical protein CME65_00125 [Halobacteriovoraceae bacterium]|nr:hypothetical protein [Halobacteriovoraceae bacterium]|tara:strand:+ start:9853 stop:11100 length:1248 start_codon:yes stop_codon:yes gene_type:complete